MKSRYMQQWHFYARFYSRFYGNALALILVLGSLPVAAAFASKPILSLNSSIEGVHKPASAQSPTDARLLKGRTADLNTISGDGHIVFIDAGINDFQSLINAVVADAKIYLLSRTGDGVREIAAILAEHRDVRTVHIFAHGEEASVRLGLASLDIDSLKDGRYKQEMLLINRAMAENGDFKIYSCNTGRGERGQLLVNELALLTGADVAASNDLSGNAEQGADWELEVVAGVVGNDKPWSMDALKGFTGVLATETLSIYTDQGATLTDQSTLGASKFVASGSDAGGLITNTAGSGAYLDNILAQDQAGLWIRVDVDGTNLTAFELTGLTLAEFEAADVFQNISVTGYVFGGGTVTGSIADGSTGADTFPATLTNFAGVSITGFKIDFDAIDNGGVNTFIGNIDLAAFTWNAANNAPTIGGTSVGQAVNDNATVSLFSAVTIVDLDGDNVTTTVALDTNAKGAFTSASLTASGFTGTGPYSLASATVANVQTAIRQLVYAPSNDRVAPTSTETTTFTITVNDSTVDGTNSTTTVISTSINDAPGFTGTPSISGTAAVGNILSAVNITINDPDPSDVVTLSYQWKADGSNISGATSNTYVLTSNEAHKTITLDVLGTDSYTATTGTSTTAGVAVANAVPVNTVLPVISGTVAVGNVLSSTTGTWTDADGDTSIYSYQWKADGASISGATSSSYTLTTGEAHKTITVTVTADDGNSGSTAATSIGIAVANAVPVNTVVPVISGTAAVGSVLSSTTGIWTDADGDTSTYSYQWKADGTNIAGATSSSYTLTTGEAHKTITVTVTADDGNSGSTAATSTGIAVANAVPVNTVVPVISGTAAVGSVLSSTTGIWTDADGDTSTYSYQWKADGTNISGATSSSYTLTIGEAHKTITVTVTADDGNSGSTAASSTGIAMANAVPVNTVVPVISGTAAVGSTLSSTTGTWTDADGDTPTYSYQWYRADDGSGTNLATIAGATASSYTLVTADALKYLRIVVTADDGNGSADQTSTSTYIAVTNAAPVNAALPVISGTAAVGNALSSTTGTWTDADGDTPVYSYQWKADGTNISGATSNSYTLTTGEAHKTITVTVTADDGNSGSTAATSTGTAVANAVPVNTVVPVISGTAAVGNALSSTTGTWTDADGDTPVYSYQWKADGTNISGATSSGYTLTIGEAHKTIMVTVTADDGNSGSTAATSIGIAVANAVPVNTAVPVISGTAAVSSILNSTAGTWTDADGDTSTYSYQWKADGASISGATSSSYTLTTGEAHKTITVTVTADDGNSGSTAATSTGTAVANAVPVNTVVPVISGTAAVGSVLNSTTGTWTDTDGDTSTYSYQWKADGASISGATSNSYTLTTSEAHKTITVTVTADDGNSGSTAATSIGTAVLNTAPVNTVPPVISGTASVGSTLSSTTGTWTDADGDTPVYSYQWKADGSNISAAVSSSYTLTIAEASKAITVAVTANDGNGGSTVADSSAVTGGNTVPSITSTAVTLVNEDSAYSYTFTATDNDGDTLTLSAPTLPGWMSFNAGTGVLSGTPTNADVGTHSVVLRVNDGTVNVDQSFSVAVANTADAPVISSTAVTGATEDTIYSYTFVASDVDVGDTLILSAPTLPGWLSFNAGTGHLSGTPTNSEVGNHSVLLRVNDGTVDVDQSFIIIVANVNDAPVLSGSYAFPGTTEDADSIGVQVTTVLADAGVSVGDDDGNTLGIAVTAINGNGTGQYSTDSTDGVDGTWTGLGTRTEDQALLLSETAWLRYQPDQANGETVGLSFRAWDQSVGTEEDVVDSTINGINTAYSINTLAATLIVSDVNDAAVINSTAVTAVNEDSAYSYTFVASDVDTADTLTYSAPTLPVWMSFNATTGVLSGTPANGDVGNTSVVLRVNDGSVNVDQAFMLIVANTNDAPVISGTPTTRVLEGQAYSFTPSATDVDVGDSLSFVITNKPGWASFETATGTLTGTPAAANIGTTTGVVLGVNDGISTRNLSIFSITVVGDLDGDTVGDDVDTDIDGDGMDNVFENANGLDPRNAVDAALDSDNDGLDNLSEYQQGLNPTVDDNPPVVTAPADVVIDATGLRTLVNLGAASAVDALDGTLTAVADQSGHFAPGRYVVTWSAQDAAGNTSTAQQVVDVRPLAQFSKNQKLVEGVTATLRVYLNGVAPVYPVEIPYSVAGSATQPDDFVLADGVLVITVGTEAELSIDLIDDGMDNEFGETIEIVMGIPTNAAVGSHATHTLTLVEGNLAPIVSLHAVQGNAVTVVTQDGGMVVVSATMTDPNPDDGHSYDWSGSDNALVDTDTTGTTFSFDPSGVPEGVYTVSLQVTDDGMPVLNGEGLLRLRVIATAPTLNTGLDSDGDGVMDADEGSGDEDNDGVSDYVDAISASNVLQGITGTNDSFLIETEAGLQIRLGSAAFTMGSNAAQVTDSSNDEVTNIGGIFDVEITGLSTAGQALQVILPQVQPIPANAVYREQLPSGWIDFEQDSDNRLSSAPGAEGQCPAPGDAAFEPGLVEGYWCVQLKIQDGGPNDGDSQINNAVVSFGGVAQQNTTSVSTRGGGSILLMLLILLALVCLRRLQATGQGWRLLARIALFAPVILVAGLLPDAVQASDKLLVGVSYLRANGPESSGEFNRELAVSGLQATVTQTGLSRNGGRIFIRYQESEQLAIELAYVDLGDVTTKITGLNSSVSTFLANLSDVFPATANGWSLRVAPRYAVGKNIDFVAALGLFRWRADYTLTAPTQKKRFHLDGIDLSYGLAIEHRLTDKLQPHLGWQAYQVGDKVIHTLDLGVAYWF